MPFIYDIPDGQIITISNVPGQQARVVRADVHLEEIRKLAKARVKPPEPGRTLWQVFCRNQKVQDTFEMWASELKPYLVKGP